MYGGWRAFFRGGKGNFKPPRTASKFVIQVSETRKEIPGMQAKKIINFVLKGIMLLVN